MKKPITLAIILLILSIPTRHISITIENTIIYQTLHAFSYTASLAFILPLTLLLYIKYHNQPWAKSLTLSIITAGIIITILKLALSTPRPYENYLNIEYIKIIDQYGYPSGHTTAATIYIYHIHEKYHNKKYTTLALTWTILIGISRILTGSHYLGDTLAGYAIGLLTTIPIHKYLNK